MGAAFEQFLKYKNRVPVRGAIMLTDKMDEVLLVKGWKKSGTWSFPRGKINKDESDIDCAVREAWEETGFDLRAAGLVDEKRKPYPIDQTIRSQSIRLFIFRGVPRDAHFVPQTRKEISKIEWYKLSDLPTLKKKQSHQEGTISANKFYMVAPFMQHLKKYIAMERKRDKRHSSNLAVPPTAVGSTAFNGEQQHLAVLEGAMGPVSPPIPSSLPEVTPSAMLDPALLLKQQLNIPAAQSPTTTNVDSVKSNALLALLRSGSAVEMRNDPHTPLEKTAFAPQPQSPERPTPRASLLNMQSPPPTFDTHQQVHPSAPPPSALPQLSQHKMSLLQAFQLNSPPSQAAEARRNLTAPKQGLLAALMSPKATPSVPPNLPPAKSPANDLLALLQPKQLPTDAPLPNLLPGIQAPPPTGQAIATPVSVSQISPTPPPNHLLQTMLLDNALRQQGSHLYESDANTDTDIPRAAPLPTPSPKPLAHSQTQPVELPAVSESTNKALPIDKTKANLLSLLGSMPPKVAKVVEARPRAGSTAATLSGPINEPHFDAIPKVPISQEVRRDPVTTPRKLFDPKHDDPKRTSTIQVLSRQDDRNRAAKSPRTAKTKQDNNARRPVTPKEAQKPFQPQILKRPQTAEGEASEPAISLLARTTVADSETAAKTTPSVKPSLGLVSPSLDAPQPVSTQSPVDFFSPLRQPSHIHDPQREALLSLLKTPTQKPAGTDTESTPKAPVSGLQPRLSQDNVVPSPTPAQLVSPVMDGEFQQSAPRSRVSSLASTGNGLVGGPKPLEKRQTTASDKAFLMNYLKSFATQGAS